MDSAVLLVPTAIVAATALGTLFLANRIHNKALDTVKREAKDNAQMAFEGMGEPVVRGGYNLITTKIEPLPRERA
jgi:hypothetical protein